MMTFDGFLLMLAIAGFGVLALLGYLSLVAKARKKLRPMIAREHWTNAEYRDYVAKLDAQGDSVGGSLLWQSQEELRRLGESAARLGANLATWREMERDLGAQAATLDDDAATAMAGGDEARARSLVAQRRQVAQRQEAMAKDIAQGEATLCDLHREILALEGRLGDDLRRDSLAQARISGARDRIRARQLQHGTLAEAAMAKAEAKEREAKLAEAEAEALELGQRPALSRDFEALEMEREIERLKRRGSA